MSRIVRRFRSVSYIWSDDEMVVVRWRYTRWRQLEVILFVHTAGFKSCTTTGPLKSTPTAILSDGDMGLICISACWASLWRLHLARYQPLNSSVTKNHSETALSTWRACKVHEPNDHFVTRFKRPIFCYPIFYRSSGYLMFLGFYALPLRILVAIS